MTKNIKFCKFCRGKVEFFEEMNDYRCIGCYMFQSLPTTFKEGFRFTNISDQVSAQMMAELERLQGEISSPWQDTPFTPNRPFIVRRLKMKAGRFAVLDLEEKTLGFIRIVPALLDRDFVFLDASDNELGYVNAHVGLLKIQERKYEIYDKDKKLRGRIVRKKEKDSPLLLLGIWTNIFEIYDAENKIIYRGIDTKYFGNNYRLVSNNMGGLMLMFKTGLNIIRDQSEVVINPQYDPLLMLAYYFIVRYHRDE